MFKRHSWLQDGAKRLFDFSMALAGLLLLSPGLVVIAISIKLDSLGPVFYRGVRTGLHGKSFRIFKFRTMIVDADLLGGTTTGTNDARLTRIGRLLRGYKLDELPQLINVVLGNMSLVGPRPEVEEYTKLFTEDEKRILSILPGITDLSSLKFHDLQSHVGAEDPDTVFREIILPQKNALRLQYVDHCSFWGDITIIYKTIRVLLVKSVRSVF